MKLLPYERYVLTTKLNMGEVIRRMQYNVSEKHRNIFTIPKEEQKVFTGNVREEGFIVSRRIAYRNSFLPIITGYIDEGFGETQIRITMRMSYFVSLFMIVWLGFTLFALIQVLYNVYLQKMVAGAIFPPLFMFLAGYGLMMICFKLEANKAKAMLRALMLPNSNETV
jgi:hypothetical protein